MSETQHQLMEMNQRYDLLGEKLVERQQELKDLLSGVKTYLQDLQDVLTWLDDKEKTTGPFKTLPTKAEEAERRLKEHQVCIENGFQFGL